MNILIVTNMYPTQRNCASGTFVMNQVDQLRRLGHLVDIVHIQGWNRKLKYLTNIYPVIYRTITHRYDIVHAHYGLSAFTAMFRWRTPLVVTLHGSDALYGFVQPLITRFACRFADAVVPVSRNVASVIGGEIIPCGIDLDVFQPYPRAQARMALNLPTDKCLLLFPFNPSRKGKRYDLAQSVAADLRSRGLDVELFVVHSVPNNKMPLYYCASDVMLLCSAWEGSPTSVKEALSCNIPVVATDVGDVREIMGNIPGTKICTHDPRSLADGIVEVMEFRKSHRFEGRLSVSRYNQNDVISRLMKVYEKVRRRYDYTPYPALKASKARLSRR